MTEETRTLPPDDAGIAAAADLLRAGRLTAFPTETVYGLGADARDDRAVAAVFAAKGRPNFNPLIIHVASLSAAEAIAVFDDDARRLAQAFWPGPLTLVLPLRDGARISPLATAGLGTVALRVPGGEVALRLLAAFGGPIAAPSANPSGQLSPTRAEHVLAGLGGRIAALLDGGPCTVGIESTIIGPGPRLLREGGVPVEAIEACLGMPLTRGPDPAIPIAPGQLASHYAPRAALRLDAARKNAGEIWIGFGADCPGADDTLSAVGDLHEAAASLFHVLAEADRKAGANGTIAVAPIPETGLGRAINDRLRRAAAPRG